MRHLALRRNNIQVGSLKQFLEDCVFWVTKESYIFNIVPFDIFRPVRVQWLLGCSARNIEPVLKVETLAQEPYPLLPKQEEQSRSRGISGQQMTLISRPSSGDRLGLKPFWEGKAAGGHSTRPGTGIPKCCSDRDCGPGSWPKAAFKLGIGPQQGIYWIFLI